MIAFKHIQFRQYNCNCLAVDEPPSGHIVGLWPTILPSVDHDDCTF